MFGRRHEREGAAPTRDGGEELDVDAALESAIGDVQQAVGTYLDIPSEGARRDLLASLEHLDDRLARCDGYTNSARFTPAAVGYLSNATIGATSQNSVVEELPSGVFQAQVALVKAAKQEIREHTPATLASLRAAFATLGAAEGDPAGTPPGSSTPAPPAATGD